MRIVSSSFKDDHWDVLARSHSGMREPEAHDLVLGTTAPGAQSGGAPVLPSLLSLRAVNFHPRTNEETAGLVVCVREKKKGKVFWAGLQFQYLRHGVSEEPKWWFCCWWDLKLEQNRATILKGLWKCFFVITDSLNKFNFGVFILTYISHVVLIGYSDRNPPWP